MLAGSLGSWILLQLETAADGVQCATEVSYPRDKEASLLILPVGA